MHLDIDETAIVDLLRSLVSVPSVNPGMEAGSAGEGAVGELVAAWARAEGFVATLQEVRPGRHNVLVDLGRQELPTLALVTHLDTVPFGPMSDRARTVAAAGGKVYGRGACDAKGPLAAMLIALRALRERRDVKVNVVVAAMVDEEHTFQGVLEYVRRLTLESRPIAAIVGEPTKLEVVIAHAGVLRFRLETLGRAAHSSRPAEGVNAIEKMTTVLEALRSASTVDRPVPHPLVGAATFTVVQIEGGIAPNVVPQSCTAVIDRRMIPGESGPAVLAWLERQLDPLRAADPELRVVVHEPFVCSDTLETVADAPIVTAALAARAAVLGPSAPIGVPFGTDGSKLSAQGGIPTIVLGPGDIAQAHTADEWVEVSQLVQAAKIYAGCALGMAGAAHAL
jgi:acetylornithine deacetylase